MSKPHGWRRPVRWARNILLGIVGLVTVVVLGAYVFFQTDTGRGILRSQIESRLAAGFKGGATIGTVEGNPLTELVLRDVVVFDAAKRPAIKVKRLTVKLPLMPLLSHQLRVDKIIADELDVLAVKDPDGTLNLATLKNPSEPSTWSIKLPNLEVHRGHVHVAHGGEPVDIDKLELYVDAALPFAGPIDASLSVSAQWRQKQAPINVAANLHIDEQEVRVGSAAVQVAELRASLIQVAMAKGPYMRPVGGVVSLYAPKATLAQLAPAIRVPGDVALLLTARPDGRITHVAANASVGDSRVRALVDADIQAKLARGQLFADALDLTALTRGSLRGGAGGVMRFDVDANDPDLELPVGHASATAWIDTSGAPRTEAVIRASSDGQRVAANVQATGDNGLHATIDAALRKQQAKLTLEHADIVATTPDAKKASLGKVPLRGSIDVDLHASGALAPEMNLAASGHANGRRLRFNAISADSFALRLDAKNLPANPVGSARLEVSDVRRADMELGKLTVAAGNRPDGKLQVSVRSQPKRGPWLVDLDALVTTGNTIAIDLQRHFVRAAGGSVWRGDSGTVTVSPREIALHGFESRSGDGRIAADATFVRAGRGAGDLTAKLDAKLDLTKLHKGYTGIVDAHVDVARTRGKLAGTVDAKASGLAVTQWMQGTVDASVKVDAHAGKLVAEIGVGANRAGNAHIALDVDAPANIADARAWRSLDRRAVRNAEIKLDNINLAEAAKLAGLKQQQVAGTIDGVLELAPGKTGGDIRIRGAEIAKTRELGKLQADLKLAESGPDELRATVTARLQPTPAAIAAKDVTQDGAARLLVDARLHTPHRLFDPNAWKALGINAFRGGTLRAERLAFQPGTLERLGIISDMRGELAVGAEVDEGLSAARLAVTAYNLRGGAFAQPVGINVSAILDDKSSRVIASVIGSNITLVKVAAKIPVPLGELRANPQAAKTAPLDATARIDHVPARALLSVLGNTQVQGGVLDGTVKIGGTVDRPTAVADLVATNVTVPSETTKPTPAVGQLRLHAAWDGTVAKATVDGTETNGGTLQIRAQANPDELATATASLRASKIDLAPLMAFLPGPAGALAGNLDANFTAKGADPRTAEITGNLHITDGRIPIMPAVGTLFQGDVRIGIQNRTVGVNLTGKLGRGDVKLVASAPLEGATPKSGKLALTLDKVQLIGATEPKLSGTINANIARVNDVWRAEVRVDRMSVDIPEGKGHKLAPVGAPPDMVYGGLELHHGVHKGKDVPAGIVHDEGPADFKPPAQVEGPVPTRKEPGAPVAVVKVAVHNVFVESKEARGLVGGNLKLTIANDREVGIVGHVSMTRAVLDLFSRRYIVDKANLQFDGSPDPVLDVRITHDFPEVTTITEVRGRLSKPELILSSNPAQYSQAELLGFLLGGEPGGDPENAPSATERVANAGASFLANKVAQPIKKALPVDIDVLRYEAASSTNSAAVTVGTWITDVLFLAYRRHLEARPDENMGEGELEYWIRRRLVLEAVAGDRGRNGLDLLWRRRW
jgi:hypothetical protein